MASTSREERNENHVLYILTMDDKDMHCYDEKNTVKKNYSTEEKILFLKKFKIQEEFCYKKVLRCLKKKRKGESNVASINHQNDANNITSTDQNNEDVTFTGDFDKQSLFDAQNGYSNDIFFGLENNTFNPLSDNDYNFSIDECYNSF